MNVCGDFTAVHVTGQAAGQGQEIRPCINSLIASSASGFSEQEERKLWMRN